ncbi:CopG family transcriptional regulator [Microbacterium sp. LRZ72]|uniref:CopG family transcriptional regulator n=1 Tax=Microbacterium sp. LRZ72 TaxID=2942481 RepID=UPI0029B95D02|nr:CopG family transcriptional regulator [Microbacterium sp. LRZ72]MDX2376782.1 CopG family transcriptional regulator [Microbacterium sp. LRZ72]
MRTTLNLSDALASAAKERAAAEGRSFTSLLEEAVREHLARNPAPEAVDPLPTYSPRRGGLLVDLDNKEDVWSALDRTA